MKCNEKMLILLELMEAIDSAKVHEPVTTYEMLGAVVDRCLSISEQYPQGNPFRKMIDFITIDVQCLIDDIIESDFSEAVRNG
jgi:hypothetical protein